MPDNSARILPDRVELREDGRTVGRIDRAAFDLAHVLRPQGSRLEILRAALQWAQLCGHVTGCESWLAMLADVSLALESAGLI